MVDMELVNALSEVMGQVVEKIIEEKVEAIVERIIDEKVGKRLDEFEKRLDRLENDVRFIKLELENNIRPRLDQIESCYCSINALKDVVQKHSLQIKELQELAGISVN